MPESIASHIRAGEITARRVGCSGFTYEFILTAYRDTGSEILFGNGIFDFGDGESISLNPDNFFRKEIIDDEVELVQYRIQHTYGGNSVYVVSYNEDFRNAGILNMSNSSNVAFFVETTIRLDPFFGCNDSPVFLIPPVDKAAVGAIFYHNPGAFDINGDSIAFKFVIPKSREGVEVPNYQFPPLIGNGTNSQQTGPATITLDEVLGDLIWDAPALKGEYNIAFIAEEWRKIQGEWVFLGSITRDMQIIVDETDNDPPELTIPLDTCIEAGTLLTAQIMATDPNIESGVKIEAFGGPFILDPPATIDPNDGVFYTTPHTIDFSWQTNCDLIREDPYLIRFKATDNGPGIRLTDFETWSVTVVPPSPKNVTIAPLPQRSLKLDWDNYDCGLAEVIQVYRRVNSFDFTPANCEIGIPENGGYELIGAVPVSQNSFTDNNAGRGLDFGATYCYRLVAVFELPTGGVSYASEEVCEKIDATGPIVTNVSVQETDETNGVVAVSWLPPFEIDQAVYPPPYKYQLLRSNGGAFSAIAVIEDDTTFTDTGLNTLEETHTYRVDLYLSSAAINAANLIEVSATASTIQVSSVSLFEAIALSWSAKVPWSNVSQDNPYHYIYRDKVSEANPSNITLIDSVDVTTYGFNYTDSGAFNNQRLSNDQTYCYYITTTGTYGNELILDPLLNDSKVICLMPDDSVDPCPPFEASFKLGSENDCLAFLSDKSCDFNDFENVIYWSSDSPDSCDNQIAYYEVFYVNELIDDYALVSTTIDTFFVHSNLAEYAGCYKIRAVDRSENRSEFSQAFCKENCPNVSFPNIITPNGDGKNDVFTPFYPGANLFNSIPLSDCPRFLEKLVFRVFNRYGVLVYSYESGGENSLYINWKGVNNNGELLPSATYFYEVTATFDMLDPQNEQRYYKGWVQILR
ncbi:MAG: gliding motility-associated-like protein [Marivirga sp.]|jgi:gliding motility-associated-like protein